MANSALNKLKSKVKSKTLVGKQKNLDMNKNGKLDKEDFKILRGDKMAKGGEVDDFYDNLQVHVQGEGTIYHGQSMKEAIKKAKAHLLKNPKAEVVIVDEKYGDEYDLNGNRVEDDYAKGGNITKPTHYIEIEAYNHEDDDFKKALKKYHIKLKVLKEEKSAHAFQAPVLVELQGTEENIIKILKKQWDLDSTEIAELNEDDNGIKLIESKYAEGGYMAKGGELSEDKMIEKLSKQFEGKDLWDDEIMDEYEVKMFDYRDDEEIEKWKNKNKKKNYIVPFDSEDDSYIFILVPKDKMAKGGYMAKGGETKEEKSYIIVGRNITIKSDDVKDFIKRANANGYTLKQVYKKDDEEVKSANPIYDFSWKIGLPRFKELVGPMKDGPNKFRYEDEWVNERMSVEKGGYMNDGGETYDKDLFKKELAEFKKEIKEGYGWISPDYVSDSWENMGLKTNISDFKSQAAQDLFKNLIDSGLLYHEEYEGNEEQGEKIESFRELYGFDYGDKYAKGGLTEHGLKVGDTIIGKGIYTIKVSNKKTGLAIVNLNTGEREEMKAMGGYMAKGGETNEYNSARLLGRESQDWEAQGREYAGAEWDKLTQSEKDEIISDLQRDWDRNTHFKQGGYMANGGSLAEQNNDMLQSTITEMKHHVDELKSVVSNNTEVEPWVIAKAERASTDLSDITHYLEGEKQKGLKMPFEKGGYMAKGGMTPGRYYKDNSGNELRYIGESQGKLLFKDGEKIVEREESDFEDSPKENKLFGFFEDGGEIKNQYENLTPKEIWSMWTEKQRMHFIRDHKHEFPEIMDSTFILAKKDFGKLPARVQIAVEFHTEDGEYAMGGRLSSSAVERMEGLVPVGMMREFQKNGIVLRKYLKQDGFGDKDITKYLCSKITNEYSEGGEIDSEKYEAVKTINQLKSAIATNPNIETDSKVFIDGRLSNIMRLIDKAYAGLEENETITKLYFYIDSATENIDEIQKELVSSKSQTSIESDYIAKKLEDLYDLVSNMGFNIEMENED